MFEGIKIVTTLDCVSGFVPKGWTNIRHSILIIITLQMDILIFEFYLLIENYFL